VFFGGGGWGGGGGGGCLGRGGVVVVFFGGEVLGKRVGWAVGGVLLMVGWFYEERRGWGFFVGSAPRAPPTKIPPHHGRLPLRKGP